MKNRHNINLKFSTIMKRVLFSMVLLLAVGFTFAQEKSVKEAKSIANEVKPDFAQAEKLINGALTNTGNEGQCRNMGRSRLYSKKNQ